MARKTRIERETDAVEGLLAIIREAISKSKKIEPDLPKGYFWHSIINDLELAHLEADQQMTRWVRDTMDE